MWYSKKYIPTQVGSIDGTDIDPHDNAIERATLSTYRPPEHLNTDPSCTLFVSRLNFDTTEESLRAFFEKYGEILNIIVIRNEVTGLSQGYGFVTYKSHHATREAYKSTNGSTLDDHIILVDYERSRVMHGWIPRRLGGGYGGKKESGQLRFGARDRPFRQPKDSKLLNQIDYDQNRSDNWKYSTSSLDKSSSKSKRKRSKSPSPSPSKVAKHSDHIRRTPSRQRHQRRSRSPSPHRSSYRRCNNRSRSPKSRHYEDSSLKRYSRSSRSNYNINERQKSRSESEHQR